MTWFIVHDRRATSAASEGSCLKLHCDLYQRTFISHYLRQPHLRQTQI